VSKFCFVIHPVSFEDVVRYEPGAAGKGRPIIAKILEWMPSYAAAHLTGIRTPDGRETEGWFVAAPLMPEQMLELPREAVYERILKAIQIGVDLGADVAGLGAFTGIVGDGGVTLNDRASIPVTTGNSLTIAAGVRSFFRGCAEMGVDPKSATVAVIGATGSIGGAIVELIADRVGHIVLCARNETRVRKFQAAIADRLACTTSIEMDVGAAVRQAHCVITATSSTKDIIEPEDLQTGAVVVELSLPHDVSRRVAQLRPDVLVIEGGNMRVPGNFRAERMREPGTEFSLGLPPGTALACMSETRLLALANRIEPYTLGRGIDVNKVREIDALADDAGFELADMRAFDLAITPEQIARTRAAADARRSIAV
jgi:fatty aldehyde-generating acyl-ACP reductase